MAFHAHSGWYFSRLDDGVVRMEKRDVNEEIKYGAEFDAGTWASIIASVSARGETGQTFAEAQALHG